MPTDPTRVRIVIADSHPIFRDGLRRLLETDPQLQIVGECAGGSEAAALARDAHAGILLLGLQSAGRETSDALSALPEEGRRTARTIILTNCLERPDVTRALELGACAVIPRDSSPEVLFTTIHSVMTAATDGESDETAKLRKLEVARRRSRAFGLTRRELEIVRAVIEGCTNKEIARRSAISENTVKSHLAHIFNKLGASNRVELALFASHHRLLDGV